MNRDLLLDQVARRPAPWDVAIIGGGATGAGIAVDAASRGFSVILLERFDFGSGTSSRSTKLIHGGVRYLRQGHIPLVFEALHERTRLRRNAPHLVRDLSFIIPSYHWWETPYYGLGLSIYDVLAGRDEFGPARMLACREVIHRIPTIQKQHLAGGVLYHDGQFDDSRLLINLMQTAHAHGAVPINYAPVTGIDTNPAGRVTGLQFQDAETGRSYSISAKIVVNATGVFVDGVRQLIQRDVRPLVAPSQGTHLVFARQFLPGSTALMVPKTEDGRVMFAIPWHDHTLVGTTDVAIPRIVDEPQATAEEVDLILNTVARYLNPAPQRRDVLSVFTGIRPLVQDLAQSSTAALSREHVLLEDPPGMLTITGGKWTTYRRMAEQVVDRAIHSADLPSRCCRTKDLRIRGDAPMETSSESIAHDFAIRESDIRRAVRHEMARTVEDVLARRSRVLFLNARSAIGMAPTVAAIMANELHQGTDWTSQQTEQFAELAKSYVLKNE